MIVGDMASSDPVLCVQVNMTVLIVFIRDPRK
jgi:hypothetical protein